MPKKGGGADPDMDRDRDTAPYTGDTDADAVPPRQRQPALPSSPDSAASFPSSKKTRVFGGKK